MFSSFDCIAIVLSTGIFYLNLLAEKRHVEFLKAKKQKTVKKRKSNKTTTKKRKVITLFFFLTIIFNIS